MKAVVEFKDGLEMIVDLPEECRHMETITAGRPEKPENVTAKFTGWSGNGHAIFREVEGDASDAG